MKNFLSFVFLVWFIGFSSIGFSKNYTVKMLQDGSTFKYEPAELNIKIGDKVTFVTVGPTPHTVTFDPTKIPGDSEKFRKEFAKKYSSSKANGHKYGFIVENAKYTIDFSNVKTGEYNYFCIPHKAMNMVGKIIISK
jgi:plastocyanin